MIISAENPLTTRKYNIHKDFLCYYSQHVEAKLKRGDPPLETKLEPITVEDVDPSSFGLFTHSLYFQNIRNEEGKLPGLINLAKLWVLAERFEMGAL